MPGTIEVVIGPMRSNKTAELIRARCHARGVRAPIRHPFQTQG